VAKPVRPSRPIDIDHPAVGATHVYIPGNADSLVAATAMVARSPGNVWVMLAREHRLPVLLERPLAEVGREIWCLGYSGTGNPLLPAALEAQVTFRPVHWLSATSGRLVSEAAEIPGVHALNLAGGSVVHLLQRYLSPPHPSDRMYERLGFILGMYPGARPTDFELQLANQLHAASVWVRNHEHEGAGLVRTLADVEPGRWGGNDLLRKHAAEGEKLIRVARQVLEQAEPVRGGRHGPALWIVNSGQIARGAHGKAVAARTYARQAPVALIERVTRGFTKTWIVLPRHAAERWWELMEVIAAFSTDFSYTGLRGAGAVRADEVEEFADALWERMARM